MKTTYLVCGHVATSSWIVEAWMSRAAAHRRVTGLMADRDELRRALVAYEINAKFSGHNFARRHKQQELLIAQFQRKAHDPLFEVNAHYNVVAVKMKGGK